MLENKNAKVMIWRNIGDRRPENGVRVKG